MAKTFNQGATDYTTISNDDSAANLTLGKSLMNQCIHTVLSMADWTFNRGTKTYDTVASQQYYSPPSDMKRVDYVNVTVDDVTYTPKEIKTDREWDILNEVSVEGDVPEYWFISNSTQKIGLFPIPSSAGNTITVGYTKKIKDLSVADYTTGTISGTVDTVALTGAGGATFSSAMVGRSIQIDGFWYLITAVPTAATLTVRETLKATYSGETFTISELIPFPDGFEDIPLWYALSKYYLMREKTPLATSYNSLYVNSVDEMLRRDARSVIGLVEKQTPVKQVDPNMYPRDLS